VLQEQKYRHRTHLRDLQPGMIAGKYFNGHGPEKANY
jgi:hypothetical protein